MVEVIFWFIIIGVLFSVIILWVGKEMICILVMFWLFILIKLGFKVVLDKRSILFSKMVIEKSVSVGLLFMGVISISSIVGFVDIYELLFVNLM